MYTRAMQRCAHLGTRQAPTLLRVRHFVAVAQQFGATPRKLVASRTRVAARHFGTFGDGSGKPERSPLEVYKYIARKQRITEDPKQLEVVRHLDELDAQLKAYRRPNLTPAKPKPKKSGGGGGFFGSIFGKSKDKGSAEEPAPAPPVDPRVPKGFYLYGEPGCGKTFLMDLSFRCAPQGVKRRTHFNEFMLDVHRRIHKWRKKRAATDADGEGDPIPPLADELISEAHFLCFDEFQVLDVADAMVLRRLFAELFARGMVVMATSNRAPTELYKNGIQRASFLPFIDQIQEQCSVVELHSGVDYRLLGTNLSNTYFTPLNEATQEMLDKSISKVTQGESLRPTSVQIKGVGRELEVPRAANGVAVFTFDEICRGNTSAADYMALTANFHTIIITDVPVLSQNVDGLNPVRRFITLIDELYQSKTRVVITAAAPPAGIFDTSKKGKYDEAFAFDRCVSRLMEMQSKEYADQLRVHMKRES